MENCIFRIKNYISSMCDVGVSYSSVLRQKVVGTSSKHKHLPFGPKTCGVPQPETHRTTERLSACSIYIHPCAHLHTRACHLGEV